MKIRITASVKKERELLFKENLKEVKCDQNKENNHFLNPDG